jgi:hypothetical protein
VKERPSGRSLLCQLDNSSPPCYNTIPLRKGWWIARVLPAPHKKGQQRWFFFLLGVPLPLKPEVTESIQLKTNFLLKCFDLR